MRFTERVRRLGTETAFDVLVRAKALEARGVDVIHLEIGEPDFDTPDHIVHEGINALHQGYTHYNPPCGYPELRGAIAEEAGRRRGIKVSPEQVVVTPGGKPIMFFAIIALVEPGDEVIYPDPGFPIYESAIRFAGGIPVPLVLREERGFALDPEELGRLVSERTRLIILNSPHNPTGAMAGPQELRGVAEVAHRRGIAVLSDEIYSRIVYDGRFESIASLPGMAEQTIILDGFSKTYAMTGWRLGYGVMPRELAPHITRLVVNSVSCTASFVQRAGLAALTGPQEPVEAMVAELRRRRDALVAGLRALPGVSCFLPQGAFYVFPRVSGLGFPTSQALADHLLEQTGVATLAGSAFGLGGEGYLRLSYANSLANLERALERIAAALASRSAGVGAAGS